MFQKSHVYMEALETEGCQKRKEMEKKRKNEAVSWEWREKINGNK